MLMTLSIRPNTFSLSWLSGTKGSDAEWRESISSSCDTLLLGLNLDDLWPVGLVGSASFDVPWELLALGLEAVVITVDSDWVLLFLVDFRGFSDSKLEMGWITWGSNGHSVSLSSSFDTGKYAGAVELSNIGVGGWVRALPDGPDLVGCNFDSIHSWVAF